MIPSSIRNLLHLILGDGWSVSSIIISLNKSTIFHLNENECNVSHKHTRIYTYMQEKNLENHKHCFIFGGGSRLCPGKELGIVQISVFLHYFVTRYRSF